VRTLGTAGAQACAIVWRGARRAPYRGRASSPGRRGAGSGVGRDLGDGLREGDLGGRSAERIEDNVGRRWQTRERIKIQIFLLQFLTNRIPK
jgi:hypothetical protein